MYGENGEVEYGGDMKNAHIPSRTIKDHDKHYFSGKPPEFWKEHGVEDRDLFPYMPPTNKEIVDNETVIHFMSYYVNWDPQENFYYCVENTGFETNPDRTEGTFSKYASLDDQTDGLHYYLSYIKFGIGRTTSDAAHEVRDNKINREEAVALVKKYDGEFPKKYFTEILEYLEISEDEFWKVIDSWRSPHIWEKNNNDWKLKKAVWYND